MNMVLKYTSDQINTLYNLIAYVMMVYPPKDRREKLLFVLVDQVRLKLMSKLISRGFKQVYRLTITESESIALEEWSDLIVSRLNKSQFEYERTLLRLATNESNRLYGKIATNENDVKLLNQ